MPPVTTVYPQPGAAPVPGSRRAWLGGALALGLAPAVWANPAARAPQSGATSPPRLSSLRIFIPANAGGGWDQTGRALGDALLASGACAQVVYENVGGQGGLRGLQHYAQHYAQSPDTLLIGGMVMIGALALHRQEALWATVAPLGRLTQDSLVLVAQPQGPWATLGPVRQALATRPAQVPVAGGSSGGVDHMFAGLLVRACGGAPADLNYLPHAGGREVADAVAEGRAALGIAGYSELQEDLRSGRLVALGVSTRTPLQGLPSLRSQGVDAVMANWRAVFTGQGVSEPAREVLRSLVDQAQRHPLWLSTCRDKLWAASWMTGKPLHDFIDLEQATTRTILHLLKLKAG